MPLVEKRLTDADAPGIVMQSVSSDLGITKENATSKQDTPALGAMESDTSEVSIPKASECEGVPEKSGMEEETIPEIKPRGRGRPRKERKPSRRGRPRKDGKPRDFSLKETIPQATKCEGVNRRGRPRKNTLTKTITEKCLPDTRPSRLTREMKRRTPSRCELEIAQPFELSHLKRQRFTETDTVGLVIQSVSSDLGISSEIVAPQQTTVEEDASKIQAAPEPFVIGKVQLENGANIPKPNECKGLPQKTSVRKETISKAGKCKEVRPKGRPRKEELPKASECKGIGPKGRPRKEVLPEASVCKEVRPKGRPRKDVLPEGSECKEVRAKGRTRKEILPKASECKGIGPKGRPLKDVKCQDFTPLIPTSKKKKSQKRPKTNVNLRRKRQAQRLKCAEKRKDPKYRKRQKLREKKRYALKKELERLAKLFDEADEKAENADRTSMTNDCTSAPDNASQNLNPDKSTRASRKKVKIPILIDHRPKPKYRRKVKPAIKQCKKCGLIKSNHGIYCLVCQRQLENPTKNPHMKQPPNPTVNHRKAKPRKNIKPSKKPCLKCGLIKSYPGTYCVLCQRQFENPTENPPTTEIQNSTHNRFESPPSQIGKRFFLVESQKNYIIDDKALYPFLQSSNGTIDAEQIETQPKSDYDARCAQLSNKDGSPFLQNSSDFISAYIQIKPKPELNDDEIGSYLQSSNEAIDAIKIKTEPSSDFDPICAQLWKRYETVPLSQNSSDLISAYIKVKTEPESNDAELQSSNDVTNATTVG